MSVIDPACHEIARLMAVMGHDLKQPLQIAMLFIERALQDDLATAAAQRLSVAMKALGRLDLELSELACASQYRTSPDALEQTVDLEQVLGKVERDWTEYAGATGVQLIIEKPATAVRSNGPMLQTILRNLVGNAIKFSPRGSCVSVRCEADARSVTVEITDTGPGISEADLRRIFDAFQRGDKVGDTSGLGLGLYIVRETARLLRHPITVRSVEGEGSTFAVVLPRCLD
ncbi:sensor histidine kinase [Rhodopseudomonas telluris]|uniref:histidine kinase n=1 Tax=Rhodopseudomonas telluris TaxID=644215 RepID=A0ABV6EZK9_9BRAD